MATTSGTQSSPKRMPVHLPVPWVYVLVYLFGVALQALAPVPSPISASPDVTIAAGLVTFSLGAAIAGWGWVTFHRAGTTKTPGERSTQLVTWGPYRFSRNPMYVGMAIAYVGEALLLRHVWPVLLLPLVLAYVNWVVIPVEQSVLQDVFGEGYREYQARVRRWL